MFAAIQFGALILAYLITWGAVVLGLVGGVLYLVDRWLP